MLTNYIGRLYKNKTKIHLNNSTAESVHLGILLALVGGFLDAYTFIERGGVFANAQTGNIVLFGVEASRGNWRQALIALPPIFAFVLGVIISEWTKKRSSLPFIKDPAKAILILEIVILFIIGFIPRNFPDEVVTVTISFVSSLQISSFRTLVDSPYSTTMSTGNLRSASYAAYIAFTEKDTKAAIRALRYFTIIFSFLLGAFLGGLLIFSIGIKSIWAASLTLIFSVILFDIDERLAKEPLPDK
ncbi:YoaK family protein [Clostridium aciditolerans]|uniref:DUF1275 domain-containing protein n=1 Tax=Clostridium aciditolerans TaxID=339861 RepID=A0A934I569_9CLOT|nr:YoaK family protein [Clostridium aciditolerans]MBI6875186.1 DUF1275 domain-containing protein [Clostridium aciditolerans]